MSVDTKLNKFMTNADDGSEEPVDAAVSEDDSYEPQYRMIGAEKVPVSKKHGAIWKSRKEAGIKKIKDNGDDERWDTAIKYYRADQQERRDNSDVATDKDVGVRLSTKGMESENIVFANTSALVPATYAKNPKVECTSEGREDLKPFARVLEKLINVLIGKKGAMGIDLKNVARRSVVMGMLTNYAYVEIGYTRRDQADQNSVADLQKLADQLAKAKTKKEIREIEGKLMAMDNRIDVLRPSGPYVKFRDVRNVVVDPDANSMAEANWLMFYEYLDNSYVLEMFGKKNEEGEYESIFQPTHILKVGENEGSGDAFDDQIKNFTLFSSEGDKSAKDYGFDNDDAFNKAKRTKVWYVWDKATRRVYMYNDADWKFPLWVWNDPYNYDEFFSLEQLEFYTDPSEFHARSEVTYYIDQQDGLNTINNEVAKTRQFIVGKFLYNTAVLGDDAIKIVESLLDGTNSRRAIGVSLPPDTDLGKAMVPLIPASAHALGTTTFDRQRIIESVDRVSSVTNVMRGVEYKTNTTNKAIESYESNTQTRLDEKIDAIEDFIGGICWKIGQLLIANMEAKDVAEYLGDEHAATWDQYIEQVRSLRGAFTVTCVGGSTLKPTSANKKQQAAQIGQILGQFARNTPAAIIVALKTMEQAYDEVIISAEDWQMIMQGVQQAMAQPQPAAGGQGDKPKEGAKPGTPEEQQQADPAEAIRQLITRLNALPMQLKIEFGKAIAANVPFEQAVAQVMQAAAGINASANPENAGA